MKNQPFYTMTPAKIIANHAPLRGHAPNPLSNDNQKEIIVTGLSQEYIALFRKWGFTSAQARRWSSAINVIGQHVTGSAAHQGKRLMSESGMNVMASTACICMSLINLLFAYIKHVDQQEGIFLLEEVARQTQQTINHHTKG